MTKEQESIYEEVLEVLGKHVDDGSLTEDKGREVYEAVEQKLGAPERNWAQRHSKEIKWGLFGAGAAFLLDWVF